MRSDGDGWVSAGHAHGVDRGESSAPEPTPPPEGPEAGGYPEGGGYDVTFVAHTDATGAEALRQRLERVGRPVLHVEAAGVVRVRLRCRHAGRGVAEVIAWGPVEGLCVEARSAW